MSNRDKLFLCAGIVFVIALSLGMILGTVIASKNYQFYSGLHGGDYIILQLQRTADSSNIELGRLIELIEKNLREVESIILYSKKTGNRIRVGLMKD